MLEKTLENLLDCKEIQPIHSNGGWSWVFFGRNDAKAETPVLWSPPVENSERDGNTRPPDLPLEKSVCRSGSNS